MKEWVLITGASDGIGREFAKQIAVNHFNLAGMMNKQMALLSRRLPARFTAKVVRGINGS